MSREHTATLDGDLVYGEFLVRPLLKEVVRIGDDGEQPEARKLPDKAMGVLLFLTENRPKVCEREAILDAVWGEDAMRPGHPGHLTIARLRSAHRDMVVSARNLDSDAGSESRFQQDLRSATDRLLCESDRLSSREGACVCLRAAEPKVAQQRPSEVLPLLQRAVDLDPDLLQAYDRLAQAYVMLGDPLQAQPADPWINCRLGLLYARQGRHEKALPHFRRGLEIFDRSADIDFAHRCVEEGRRLLGLAESGA